MIVVPVDTRMSDSLRIVENRWFFVSRLSVSSASVTGTPARRNVAIWREKCMISTRPTRSRVISVWRPFRCVIDVTRMP